MSTESRLYSANIRSSDSGKTVIYDVFNADVNLGEVRWHGPWRKYCFYPKDNRLFDRSCLMEIVGMLDEQMKARKTP